MRFLTILCLVLLTFSASSLSEQNLMDVGVVYYKFNNYRNAQELNSLDLSNFGEDGILFACKDTLPRRADRFGIINNNKDPIIYLTNKADGKFTSMFMIQGRSVSAPKFSYPIEVWEGGVSVDNSAPDIYKIKFMHWAKTNYMREEERTDTTYYLNRGDFSVKYLRVIHHEDDWEWRSSSRKGQCTILDKDFMEELTKVVDKYKKKAEENRTEYESELQEKRKKIKI
jgi:hypothetical protein